MVLVMFFFSKSISYKGERFTLFQRIYSKLSIEINGLQRKFETQIESSDTNTLSEFGVIDIVEIIGKAIAKQTMKFLCRLSEVWKHIKFTEKKA